MNEDYFFSNNSFQEHEEDEYNSLFSINQGQQILPFQNQDYNLNYYQDLNNYQHNNDNFTLNLDNSIKMKNSLFQDNNLLNKDLNQISPIPIPENDDSFKQQIYNNNNSSITGSNSSSTKDKSQLKNEQSNNNNPKDLNEKNKKEEKNVLTKKRKPRVHLEDLNIDPEIIKDKKYEKIGDKVITSKNKIITDIDKKEIRAIRNRISAQKSRDRKKAEFIALQENVKYLKDQLEKKILIIQSYEKIACSQCKSKMNEINKKFLEDNDINKNNFPSEQSEIPVENEEGLVLEENNSIFSEKKNSLTGKISGVLIGLVCLIGIIICIFEGGFIPHNQYYIQPQLLYKNSNQDSLRHLNDEKNKSEINYNENDTNLPLPIDSIKKNNNENDFLQVCHDKFTLEIIANLTKQKEQKKGFLMKKKYNKGSIIDNRVCFETSNIISNNYIINNSFIKNTLPIESNNIILNNNLSNKIISVLVKDYDELGRYVNGKYLSLQEQIEIEAKNSEDGCVYLQMIIPKNKINKNNNDNSNGSISEYESDFFEIRCKIFAYNNYYNRIPSSY